MVYGAARVCKGINLRGREAYATVPNTFYTTLATSLRGRLPTGARSYGRLAIFAMQLRTGRRGPIFVRRAGG